MSKDIIFTAWELMAYIKKVILKKGISASTLPCFYPEITGHFKSKPINSGIKSTSISQPQGYYCVYPFHAKRKYSAIKGTCSNAQLVKPLLKNNNCSDLCNKLFLPRAPVVHWKLHSIILMPDILCPVWHSYCQVCLCLFSFW